MTDEGPNPLFERQRQSSRTTINGVPLTVLGDQLPPAEPCPDCGFPTWRLDDPDAIDGDDVKRHLTMRAEYSPICTVAGPGRGVIASLTCRHPYHLISHDKCSRGLRRADPVLPPGLIRLVI